MKETKIVNKILATLSFLICIFMYGSAITQVYAGTCTPGDSCITSYPQACNPPVGSPTTYVNYGVSPPQTCTPYYREVITKEIYTNLAGVDNVKSTTSSGCAIDNNSLQGCSNTVPPQCDTNADCGTNNACNTFTCVTTSTPNPVYNGTNNYFIKYCSMSNSCSGGTSSACGDGYCNGGETNSSCPSDCPNAAFCPDQPRTSIQQMAWIYYGVQGQNTDSTYKVTNTGGASYGNTQSFDCPSGNRCGYPTLSTTNPQNFSNPADPDFWYTYRVNPTFIGSRSIAYRGASTASNASCNNAATNGTFNLFIYRGDPYNVNVSNSGFCGVNYITWYGYNQDDQFNVYRALASSPGNLTQIASGINRTYFSDNTATPGTRYVYFVEIANRQAGWGSLNKIAANQNYTVPAGVAPVACPAASLSASPTSIISGNSSTLTWTVSNASSCTSVGTDTMPSGNWTGGNNGNSSTGALTSSKTYQLRCSGGGTTVTTNAVTVNVSAPSAPAVNLTVDSSSVSYNGSTTLRWSVSNATSCTNIGANNIPNANWTTGTNGNVGTGNLTSSQSYRLRCTGPGGSADSPTVTVSVSSPAPTASLSADSTSLSYNGSTTLRWTIANATSCTNIGADSIPSASWSSGSTGNVGTGNLTSSKTYRLSCTGPGGSVQSNSVTITVAAAAAPTVSLSATPNPINSGQSTTISWNVTNATSCTNIGANNIPNANWTSGTTGSVSSGTLTSNQTYRLRCSGPGGSTDSNTLTVTVNQPPITPGGPGSCNATSCNPTPPGGSSFTTCSSSRSNVRLIWTDNSTDETGFKIFKDGSLLTTVGSSAGTGTVRTYDLDPGDTNNHTYHVAATNAAGDSSQLALTNGGIAATACNPNLSTSDKDITAINGTTISYPGSPSPCNAQTQALPSSVNLKEGDVVSFRINICNDTGLGAANNIVITDRFVNLSAPTSGWNVKYCNGTCTSLGVGGGSNQYNLSGSAPNQTMTINLTGNNIAVGGSAYVTLDAKLTPPGGFNGSSARFQNSFSISSNGPSAAGSTPLLPFYTGNGTPIIIEVP